MFIVIEGIDGAGCETQAKNVYKFLQKEKIPASFLKYPDYERNIGKLIKDFLYENKNLSAEAQFLVYTLQFILDKKTIDQEKQKKILIADRYFTTTLCYQTLEGIKEQKALEYADDFGIVKPDMVFFLDVTPEIAHKRKYGENKVLNFREKDLVFMQKTYTRYQDLVKRNVWTKWIRIDGEREAGIITEEICQKICQSNKH